MTGTGRAVVIGASMAGLLAARVLSEFFERVTVLDRDRLPSTAALRRGVPQARHAHGLLARGREILEELFPGLSADLIAQGAVSGDLQTDIRWYNDGRRLRPARSGLNGLGVSRPLLESYVRARVDTLAGVEILGCRDVAGLNVTPDRRVVRGVRVLPQTDDVGGVRADEPADLVLDATGRGSRSPVWLAQLGYPQPVEESVRIRMTYSTRYYRREPHQFGGSLGVLVGAVPPVLPRGGAALAQEGHRWVVGLAGGLGVEPPVDPAGFTAFAATLAAADIAELIRDAEPLDQPVRARFPASVRHRYEYLRTFPEGYLVVGDAMCSFNPIYGQGMTVAAAEALVLRDCLRRGHAHLARRFFRRAAALIDVPWSMAVGSDLRFPEVEGPRPLRLRVVNRYLPRLHVAAAQDPRVGRTFLQVANLLARPERLLSPPVAIRVLRANLRQSE
ncbi:MAG TPA: FAD-binding monooxygenase [Pseudonocardiaceae bacterium]|jgi:2-polyprenyl-6-methoxyphenol hydroxylase-like FAD-dependent oxidoreductase|nr:FAD-binding monooxygenase [Pseudonocardiaceae bacterium]